MNRLLNDIDFAHRRRWPDRPTSLASRAWLLASSPGLRLLLMHRIAHRLLLKRRTGWLQKCFRRIMIVALLPLQMLIKNNTKSDIDYALEIDGGVCFSDQGHIFFGAKKTGAGTVIGTRVTVGQSHVDGGSPRLGRNVWIGSDCVVYGGINVGDGATLLPGTVLTKSVPAGVVMQGNPARLLLRDFDNSRLRERQDADAMQYVNATTLP